MASSQMLLDPKIRRKHKWTIFSLLIYEQKSSLNSGEKIDLYLIAKFELLQLSFDITLFGSKPEELEEFGTFNVKHPALHLAILSSSGSWLMNVRPRSEI